MKKLILTSLLIAAISSVYAQTKPRQVTIKKTRYVDSTYYLPDTLAVVFKELIIKPDTTYEKWQRGYVIWQTWQKRSEGNFGLTGSYIGFGTITATNISWDKIEWKFPYTEGMQGGFMYSDRKTRVKNKVLLAIKSE